MKKKMFCLALLVGLLTSGTMTAYATETAPASGSGVTGDWSVIYTEAGKVDDNLGGGINDRLSTMQPGDEITVSVDLSNHNSAVAHWYMKNNVINSMEQAGSAKGGAYTYALNYVDPAGNSTVLYTSETVGGDSDRGLLDVDSRLGDYFYLGSIANGQSGRVELTVGLDGETQGNSYMGQMANLSMQFAVEPQPESTGGGGTTRYRTVKREVINDEVVYVDEDGVPLAGNTDIVKTSDEMNLFPYVLTACISGVILLLMAVFGMRERKEEKGGAAV